MDAYAWIPDLTRRLGIDMTDDVRLSLTMWAQTEGMPDSANNVLAATDTIAGSQRYNSAGVQTYPSIATMNYVYAHKFRSAKYHAILDALASGTMLDIFNAINQSPWCPDCQGGDYPNVLHQFLVSIGFLPGATFTQLFKNPPNQSGPSPESWDIQIAVSRSNIETVTSETWKHAHNLATLRF